MFHVFPPSKKLREEVQGGEGGGGRREKQLFKGALVVGNYGLGVGAISGEGTY